MKHSQPPLKHMQVRERSRSFQMLSQCEEEKDLPPYTSQETSVRNFGHFPRRSVSCADFQYVDNGSKLDDAVAIAPNSAPDLLTCTNTILPPQERIPSPRGPQMRKHLSAASHASSSAIASFLLPSSRRARLQRYLFFSSLFLLMAYFINICIMGVGFYMASGLSYSTELVEIADLCSSRNVSMYFIQKMLSPSFIDLHFYNLHVEIFVPTVTPYAPVLIFDIDNFIIRGSSFENRICKNTTINFAYEYNFPDIFSNTKEILYDAKLTYSIDLKQMLLFPFTYTGTKEFTDALIPKGHKTVPFYNKEIHFKDTDNDALEARITLEYDHSVEYLKMNLPLLNGAIYLVPNEEPDFAGFPSFNLSQCRLAQMEILPFTISPYTKTLIDVDLRANAEDHHHFVTAMSLLKEYGGLRVRIVFEDATDHCSRGPCFIKDWLNQLNGLPLEHYLRLYQDTILEEPAIPDDPEVSAALLAKQKILFDEGYKALSEHLKTLPLFNVTIMSFTLPPLEEPVQAESVWRKAATAITTATATTSPPKPAPTVLPQIQLGIQVRRDVVSNLFGNNGNETMILSGMLPTIQLSSFIDSNTDYASPIFKLPKILTEAHRIPITMDCRFRPLQNDSIFSSDYLHFDAFLNLHSWESAMVFTEKTTGRVELSKLSATHFMGDELYGALNTMTRLLVRGHSTGNFFSRLLSILTICIPIEQLGKTHLLTFPKLFNMSDVFAAYSSEEANKVHISYNHLDWYIPSHSEFIWFETLWKLPPTPATRGTGMKMILSWDDIYLDFTFLHRHYKTARFNGRIAKETEKDYIMKYRFIMEANGFYVNFAPANPFLLFHNATIRYMGIPFPNLYTTQSLFNNITGLLEYYIYNDDPTVKAQREFWADFRVSLDRGHTLRFPLNTTFELPTPEDLERRKSQKPFALKDIFVLNYITLTKCSMNFIEGYAPMTVDENYPLVDVSGALTPNLDFTVGFHFPPLSLFFGFANDLFTRTERAPTYREFIEIPKALIMTLYLPPITCLFELISGHSKQLRFTSGFDDDGVQTLNTICVAFLDFNLVELLRVFSRTERQPLAFFSPEYDDITEKDQFTDHDEVLNSLMRTQPNFFTKLVNAYISLIIYYSLYPRIPYKYEEPVPFAYPILEEGVKMNLRTTMGLDDSPNIIFEMTFPQRNLPRPPPPNRMEVVPKYLDWSRISLSITDLEGILPKVFVRVSEGAMNLQCANVREPNPMKKFSAIISIDSIPFPPMGKHKMSFFSIFWSLCRFIIQYIGSSKPAMLIQRLKMLQFKSSMEAKVEYPNIVETYFGHLCKENNWNPYSSWSLNNYALFLHGDSYCALLSTTRFYILYGIGLIFIFYSTFIYLISYSSLWDRTILSTAKIMVLMPFLMGWTILWAVLWVALEFFFKFKLKLLYEPEYWISLYFETRCGLIWRWITIALCVFGLRSFESSDNMQECTMLSFEYETGHLLSVLQGLELGTLWRYCGIYGIPKYLAFHYQYLKKIIFYTPIGINDIYFFLEFEPFYIHFEEFVSTRNAINEGKFIFHLYLRNDTPFPQGKLIPIPLNFYSVGSRCGLLVIIGALIGTRMNDVLSFFTALALLVTGIGILGGLVVSILIWGLEEVFIKSMEFTFDNNLFHSNH